MWYLFGETKYIRLYTALDYHLGGIDQFATTHGGQVFGLVIGLFMLLLLKIKAAHRNKP